MDKRVPIGVMLAATVALALFLCLSGEAGAYPDGWTLQRQITGSGALNCDIDAYGQYVFATWERDDGAIVFKRSTDMGATWSAGLVVENGAYDNEPPVVVVGSPGSGSVYVLWPGKRDGGGYFQTWIARSTDWGATFPSAQRWHSTGDSNKSGHDACRWDENNVILYSFVDDSSGSEEIRWGKIHTNGSVTTGGTLSATDGIQSHQPVVACNGNADAFVVWTDEAGGSYSRKHLVCKRTVDSGENWSAPGSGVLPYSSDYRQCCPSVFWEDQYVVLVYQGQVVNDNHYYFGRYFFNPFGADWTPGTTAQSEQVDTGSVATYPETVGFSAGDCFFRNASNRLSEWNAVTDFLGAETIASGGHSVSVASKDHTNDGSLHYACAATSDGKVLIRREDLTGTSAVLTKPSFTGAEPFYSNNDFPVECRGAADDFDVNGTDIGSGKNFSNGFENITYHFTTNEATWTTMPCVGENSIATTAPFNKTVDTESLNQRCIKIKTTSTDTAGNTAEWISPWIYIDKDPPETTLARDGTAGSNGFYVSDVDVSFEVKDYTPVTTYYKVENLLTGSVDSNWTTYSKPFELDEGRWRVHFYSKDRAGNVEVSRKADLSVDRTPPVPSVSRPAKDTIQTGYYSSESFRITGTATDRNGLSWAAIYVDNVKKYETTCNFNMAFVWSLEGVKEGVHNIGIKAKDAAGNPGRTSKNVYVGNVAKDWYFAEGNTLPEFDEWLCVLNPGDREVRYQISFMLENGEVRTFERSMLAHQRDTVRVKDYIGEPHSGVSAKVHCDTQAVVAERPVYFVYKQGEPAYAWKGGHNVMGINVLQTEWYFAEGTTRKNEVDGAFEEWICLMNPSDTRTANVVITYMLGTGQNVEKVYQVAPHSRYTVEVEKDVGVNQDVSAKVVSDIPIAAERPMYFNYHGFSYDGSNVVGATGPSKSWSFAEGCTRPGFQQWITVQNPNDVTAECTLNYMTGEGKTTRVVKEVKPRSRATVDVLSEVGDNQDVSTTIASDVPVIAERPMYFIYGMDCGKNWNGGESAVGNPAPSTNYFLAEGTTISRFDTFYTLANPRGEGCNVSIQYIFGDGSVQESEYVIDPHSRLTINVRDAIQKEANVSGSITASFPIVIERPMYFQYNDAITGGHNVTGYGVD
jgi:hypothetical protein